jgi:hypothetical protein
LLGVFLLFKIGGIEMEVIGAFIYTYLEYVIGGVGAVGYMGYILTRKPKKSNNNLRRFVVKCKQQQNTINKQVKA